MGGLRLLGVHGVGNHQPGLDTTAAATRLAEWWRAALGRRLSFDGRLGLDVYDYAHGSPRKWHKGAAASRIWTSTSRTRCGHGHHSLVPLRAFSRVG